MIDRCVRELESETLGPGTGSAEAIGESRTAKIINRSNTNGGQITFVGRLAIALPDSQHWTQLTDENGEVLAERPLLKDVLDEHLIAAVVLGKDAETILGINTDLILKDMLEPVGQTDSQPFEEVEAAYNHGRDALNMVKHYRPEEIRGEYQTRRSAKFLSGTLGFEKLVKIIAVNMPGDIAANFEALGIKTK